VKTVVALVTLLLIAPLSGTALASDIEMSGSWTQKESKIAGQWSIVQDGDGLRVHLSDDFKTKSAPDLKIFLSRDAPDVLNGKNATRNAVLVAPLDSAKGGQSFAIPEGIDLSEFRTILIQCEKYSKLWGVATL